MRTGFGPVERAGGLADNPGTTVSERCRGLCRGPKSRPFRPQSSRPPGASRVKKRRISRISKTQMTSFMSKAARLFIKSQLLTFFLVLCALGFWVGLRARPEQGGVPFQDLFEGMTVLSFREDPSDSTARFVVELAAGGNVYRQYDLDSHRFTEPMRGRDYSRSIGGSRYRPLTLRGHVDRGFWLELPDSTRPMLGADQFGELYKKSLDFVKPVGIVSTVLGTLSGYSAGFHLATWSS